MTVIFGSRGIERIATLCLFLATIVVGGSILAEGNLSRALNGVAGAIWFTSTCLFVLGGVKLGATRKQWLALLVLTAFVAFLVRPGDALLAVSGFVPAGMLAGSLFRYDEVFWAKAVPALYLPMHVGTAVMKSIVRSALDMETTIRTEAPPIAAVVPLVMLVSAIVGGLLAQRLKRQPHSSGLGG